MSMFCCDCISLQKLTLYTFVFFVFTYACACVCAFVVAGVKDGVLLWDLWLGVWCGERAPVWRALIPPPVLRGMHRLSVGPRGRLSDPEIAQSVELCPLEGEAFHCWATAGPDSSTNPTLEQTPSCPNYTCFKWRLKAPLSSVRYCRALVRKCAL